jgi:glycine/D-amino acid oxidase-like deaminating enzyme
MPRSPAGDVIVIGAGIAGIAAAWFLSRYGPRHKVILLDALAPMSFTSAQSGENYRNWWPTRLMTAFIDHSIDLMEQIAADAGERIALRRDGYVLATRRDEIDDLLRALHTGYGDHAESLVRTHGHISSYRSALEHYSIGVDLLSGSRPVGQAFPAFDPEICHAVHIRRAGSLDSYQLSQYMLGGVRANGGTVMRGEVSGLEAGQRFRVTLADGRKLESAALVVAAGPFINKLLAHIGQQLPVKNILQQKFAFEDALGAVPVDQPFAVDLDSQVLDWSEEERANFADDEQYGYLAAAMPGNVHRRPAGGNGHRWLRLGWAYNTEAAEPEWSPTFDDEFPEVVLHGAARLNPALKAYYDRMPVTRHQYGGYYTMTEENLPLVGPLRVPGAFVVGALSGFGTMAACAAADCCARWITGTALPDFAEPLSPRRYDDTVLMQELMRPRERGVL